MINVVELRFALSNDQIIDIVKNLGADRYIERANCIIFPTICHNLRAEEASMKLYYYTDDKVFTCYTECNETFDIYGLVDKRFHLMGKRRVGAKEEKVNDYDYTFYDVVSYVLKASEITLIEKEDNSYHSIAKLYRPKEKPFLIPFDERILNLFTKYYPVEWLDEGISRAAMDKYNILYSIARNKIIIPHYDICGQLVGIRGRALDPIEAEEFGKYTPLKIEDVSYAHPLSLNLYGLYEAKEGVAKKHKVIIMEGEKSCLKGYTYYGEDNIAVAACGSHINKKQILLLVNNFDIDEVIIAFDKEYQTVSEMINYGIKLRDMCKPYCNYCNFSYILDKDNLTGYKDSPIDCGKEVFEKLVKERRYV